VAAWELRRREEAGVIAVLGDWLVKAGGAEIPRISRFSGPAGLRRLAFDVSGLGRWDMTLVAGVLGPGHHRCARCAQQSEEPHER
jgi:hypothetical protein